MKDNNDMLDLSEILKTILKNWKNCLLIFLFYCLTGVLFFIFSTPLYSSKTLLFPADTNMPNTNALLNSLSGIAGTPNLSSNKLEKIKLYFSSSQVSQNVLSRLTKEEQITLLNWLNKRWFTFKISPIKWDETSQRLYAVKLAKKIKIESPLESTDSILISIETPSAELSQKILSLLIKEVRTFHNEIEKEKRTQQEKFFENESKKYREKLLRYSLNLSLLTNNKNGLIEATPTDLDLEGILIDPIFTTPQSYFEYKTAIQDMYKSFAKSLEQNFQSLKIDVQKNDALFDILDSPFFIPFPTTPNSTRTALIVCILTLCTYMPFIFIKESVVNKSK